ncbi:hypothetical protein ACFQV2_27780 [Actinokineospora soli]|uniref:Transposase n=1 Tax=Actinokineospora soli TaxID=1048753 RepID=A0ABW2TSA4_9PSEU
MHWAIDDIKAEVEYRRFGTTEKAARQHLELLRGTTSRWRRARTRGGRRAD